MFFIYVCVAIGPVILTLFLIIGGFGKACKIFDIFSHYPELRIVCLF